MSKWRVTHTSKEPWSWAVVTKEGETIAYGVRSEDIARQIVEDHNAARAREAELAEVI